MKTREQIIDRIDSVDWTNISIVNEKKANHIPMALRKIMDSDSVIRDEGYWELENYIVVQRDLYEAAYYVIPILFDMIEIEDIKNKDEIFTLLEELSFGSNGNTAVNKTIVLSNGEIVNLEMACRTLFKEKMHVLMNLLKKGERDLRISILELLATMPHLSKYWIAEVYNLEKIESDEEILLEIREVIKEIDEYK